MDVTGLHHVLLTVRDLQKWWRPRSGANGDEARAPWWSMLGRVGGGLVDLLGVLADRGGWVEELAA
jgi:hypothetical protein